MRSRTNAPCRAYSRRETCVALSILIFWFSGMSMAATVTILEGNTSKRPRQMAQGLRQA